MCKMSLHQLLQECGADDDGGGSDMEVCIDNDEPSAPAGSGSTAVLGGHHSPAAGSASFVPHEDQAQRAGDDVIHPMDVASDSSPHGQSKDGSDGDSARARPREAAEERQEGEPPGTPTRAAGGATGPAPEASGCTPTVRTWQQM